MSFRSWLIRQWWFWVLAPLAVLLVAAVAVRVAGQLEWDAEQAAARAAGEPTSSADLVAAAPVVDVARQERLWRWWYRAVAQGSTAAPQQSPATTNPALPGAAAATPETPASRELADILTAGPVVWGQGGWIRQDVASGKNPDDVRSLHAMELWETEARFVARAGPGDPRALPYLDRLLAASRPVLGIEDAQAYAVIAYHRDAEYLRAVLNGMLDPARLQAWLAEPAEDAAVCIAALRGERVWRVVPRGESADIRLLVREMWQYRNVSSWTETINTLLNGWLLRQQAATQKSRRWRAVMAVLAGTRDASTLSDWVPAQWDMGNKAWNHGDWGELVKVQAQASIQAMHQDRTRRAMTRAILAWRADTLPTVEQAETQLAPHLHADPHLLPPLRYERLSPTRFRLSVDPNGNLPAFIPRSVLIRESACGQPAAKQTYVEQRWSVELDCADLPRAGVAAATPVAPATAAPETAAPATAASGATP